MKDGYDKAIAALGLDESRTDRLLGVLERELDGLDALHRNVPLNGVQKACVCLNRLPDGRRLLMFRFGPQAEGELWPLPCSQANANVLEEFLHQAETFLPMNQPAGSKGGVLGTLRKWLSPDQPVVAMAPLLHRHFAARIVLRLLADPSNGHSLQFLGEADGGRCNYTWRWSPAVLAGWHRIASNLHGSATDWDG
jgi:hypothetical protein